MDESSVANILLDAARQDAKALHALNSASVRFSTGRSRKSLQDDRDQTGVNGQNSGISALAASQVMRFIAMPMRAKSVKR